MFFDPRKYDFSRVGRMKFNIKLHDKAEYAPTDALRTNGHGTRSRSDRRTLDE